MTKIPPPPNQLAEKWQTKLATFSSIDEFNASILRSSLISFPYEDGRFEFLLKSKNRKPRFFFARKPLIIFFNAAYSEVQKSKRNSFAGRRMPSFSGYNLLKSLDASYLCVNDPSLNLSEALNLAWYIGAEHIPAQKVIVSALKKIIEQLDPSRVIFLGGSGGGFAAMYYASFFENSLAVPWNPQSDIFKFNPSSVSTYLKYAWKHEGSIESAKKILDTKADTDLFGRYSPSWTEKQNYLLYLQNSSDRHHIDLHLKPFLENLKIACSTTLVKHGGRFGTGGFLHFMDVGRGHVAPSFGSLLSLLKILVDPKYSWHELIREGRIGDLIQLKGS